MSITFVEILKCIYNINKSRAYIEIKLSAKQDFKGEPKKNYIYEGSDDPIFHNVF